MSIRGFPRGKRFSSSAPCRIDCGGTWDIKAMALPYECMEPTTVNLALDMRTTVTLEPYKKGRVLIISEGFSIHEEYDASTPGLKGNFAIFAAAVRCMGFHGVKVTIKSEAPIKSAMGGSSTALVACLHALSKAAENFGSRPLTKRNLLHLAYQIEDAVSGGGCGMQDQAAAVYGGINQWIWQYGNTARPFIRKNLAKQAKAKEVNQRLLVAYSGKTHSSLKINRKWIDDFLSGKTTRDWLQANETARRFALALEMGNWKECARWLQEEMAIRREITPEALIPQTSLLIEKAEELNCGARFAGAGAGGVVWAIGPKERIDELREVWRQTLKEIRGARLLSCKVDVKGVGGGKEMSNAKIQMTKGSMLGGLPA